MKCLVILSTTLLAATAMFGFTGSTSALPTSPSALLPAAESFAVRLQIAARGGAKGGSRNVNRSANVSRNTNVNRNKNVNVNVNRSVSVGVVRPWVRRPYFGTVV